MKQSINPVVAIIVVVVVVVIVGICIWQFGGSSKEEAKEPDVPTAVSQDPVTTGATPSEGTGDPNNPAGPIMGGGK